MYKGEIEAYKQAIRRIYKRLSCPEYGRQGLSLFVNTLNIKENIEVEYHANL